MNINEKENTIDLLAAALYPDPPVEAVS